MNESIKKTIVSTIADVTAIPEEEICDKNSLIDEISVSSIELLAIISEIEATYEIKFTESELRSLVTIDDLVECIEGKCR